MDEKKTGWTEVQCHNNLTQFILIRSKTLLVCARETQKYSVTTSLSPSSFVYLYASFGYTTDVYGQYLHPFPSCSSRDVCNKLEMWYLSFIPHGEEYSKYLQDQVLLSSCKVASIPSNLYENCGEILSYPGNVCSTLVEHMPNEQGT